jgi:hypothetical protein
MDPWPDQREAARHLDVSVRTLSRARPDLVDAGRCRRDGRLWRYDVQAVLADPRLRCSTDGCDGVALGPSGKCSGCHYSKPRVCPGCGGPKAYHAELCRDCSADHGKLVKVQANAVKAKQRLHEQARERFHAEGLLTTLEVADRLYVSRASVGITAVPAGLHIARTEVVAGARYQLYAEPQVRDFMKDWARAGNGLRHRWWQPKHVTSILGGRSDLSARAVRDAEQRARERRAAFANILRTGRPPSPTSVRWSELYGELFGGDTVAGALGEPMPKPLGRCLEVALLDATAHPLDWPDYAPAGEPGLAARRVYRVLKRQGVL